jgi:drug/metabolite transporter (DMT)-like permease
MKWAGEAFGPISIGIVRTLGGASLLLVLWWFGRHRFKPTPSRRHVPRIAALVVINFALPYSLLPHLIGKYGDSAFFGMLVAFVPLLTIGLSIPLLGIKPSPRQVVGVLGGLACMAGLANVGAAKRIQPADLAIALSIPFAYALSNTLIKRWFAELAPLPLTATALTAAGFVLLPIGLTTGQPVKPVEAGAMWEAVASLAVLGPLCTGLAIFLFYRLIQRRGPLYAGMVSYIIPLGALAWGWVDKERITLGQVLALAGVLAMTALVQSAPAQLEAEAG